MKKINAIKLCYILSALLAIGFIVQTIFDYRQYSTTLNSAPFYLWIVVNAVFYILPAIVVLIVGLLLKKRKREIKEVHT